MRVLLVALLASMTLFTTTAVRAADASQAEIDALKRDVEDLRKKLSASGGSVKSSVDTALDSKYGPNATVTTKSGKLEVGGLLQVWYTTVRNDNKGLFNDANINGIADTNEMQDNDSFRIRRAELKFTMAIHENITAVVMIDPAREATSFAGSSTNQGLFKRINNVAPEVDGNLLDQGAVASSGVSGVQSGSGSVPRLLQDAYINYHGVIPHHDFQIGQFKPALGEEAIRSAAQLDFVERAMISQVSDLRDLGAQVHGTWWDDRFQYWLGAFNGAGNYYQSAGQFQNRSDDNDNKDFNYRALVRPLWKNETWGSIELGVSGMVGFHGEAGGADPINNPVNGLNRRKTQAFKTVAFASYQPGSIAKGAWIRGEYLWMKDRNAPGRVIDVLGAGGSASGYEQTNGKPFSSQGFYIAGGYKISDSIFCESAPSWLKPFEFAVRYEQFENVQVADLVNPSHTDVFATKVWTGGVNYYIKGHNAKVQLNYNAVREPEGRSNGGNRAFHEVDNNNFVVNFQVAF